MQEISIRTDIIIDGYPFRRYRYSDGEFGFREPKYKHLRLYLIEKYGVCYFCKCKVKDYPQIDGVSPQNDLATIDHLNPRPHKKNPTGRKKYQSVEKVLACYSCNNYRNKLYEKGVKT